MQLIVYIQYILSLDHTFGACFRYISRAEFLPPIVCFQMSTSIGAPQSPVVACCIPTQTGAKGICSQVGCFEIAELFAFGHIPEKQRCRLSFSV